MAGIQLTGIDKRYGQVDVIQNFGLTVEPGEFLVFLGPSGCGKSTLLRMIAGLEPVTAGEIRIAGRDVTDLPPGARDVAMVFQHYALYPHMTVYDNMAFSLMLAKSDKAAIKERVGRASEILGLTPLLERYPRQLSGGQRQRVAMGRAIVRDPQVFLFDEPLSNLDAKLRVQMRAEIKELHQRLRTTSVYVTHDQIEAMTMADQIVVMRDGIVEQRGRPLELYDHPANLFVAGFIGSPAMNFIPATLRRNGMDTQVEFTDGARLPAPRNAAGNDGQAVIYGVRPEHLALGTSGGIQTRVVVVEPTGANTEVYSRFCDIDLISIFRERHDFRMDDMIHLIPDHTHTHLFDASTGQALVTP